MKQGASNASYMKQHNKQVILRLIRKSPISRAEIARKTGLTRAAVSIIVDGLAEEKLVIETGTAEADYGRKPVVLEINPCSHFAIGLNISRNKYSLGIVDLTGNLVHNTEFTGIGTGDPYHALNSIKQQVNMLIEESGTDRQKLLGMGITAPGPLDVQQGIILDPPNFGLWKEVPIVSHLKEEFSFKLVLENNSRALAQAEKSYGLGNEFANFLLLVVDTGIGGGIVMNNALYRGFAGFGSEIGHTSICMDGRKCSCGNRGCLEAYASIPAIVEEAKHCDSGLDTWEKIVNRALGGDEHCRAIIEKETSYLSAAIVNTMNILELEAVVLAGDVKYRSELLRQKMEDIINSRLITRHYRHVSVYNAAIGEKPEIISSANLIIDQFFEE